MYDEILVPLDGSVLAEAALPHARALSKAFDARVTLISVIEPATVISQPGMVGPVLSVSVDAEAEMTALREYLDKIATNLRTEGIDVRIAVREGDSASEVVDYAAANREDIIVMSTHGRSGIRRWVYGSVADKVLRSANVPVLLIRAHAQG
jgi:nucleotide-binding universal stress UspA family protein